MKIASVRQILIILLPAMTILGAIAYVAIYYQVSMPLMTRDVAAIAGIHPLSGVLSNLGVLLWCGAVSICTFAAMIARLGDSRRNYWFLLFSALLSGYLMLDDFFQIHEELAGRYLGISEKKIYVLLGISALAYLTYFRKIIFETNVVLFILALMFLGFSVINDSILAPYFLLLGDWEYFIEDGAKWLGIVFWCSYFVETSYNFVMEVIYMPKKSLQR